MSRCVDECVGVWKPIPFSSGMEGPSDGGVALAVATARTISEISEISVDHQNLVLVKLTRVLANLAIHPEVGPEIAKSEQCAAALQALLERTAFSSGDRDKEELALNV
eukprot:584876-Prorocentrum_minimum.AAC.1